MLTLPLLLFTFGSTQIFHVDDVDSFFLFLLPLPPLPVFIFPILLSHLLLLALVGDGGKDWQ